MMWRWIEKAGSEPNGARTRESLGVFYEIRLCAFLRARAMGRMAIQRALISVSDKTGIADLARRLGACGVEILSTGGTARLLREEGLDVIDVSDFTGFPELFDGRVKTLHPKVHGGLLYRRSDPKHQSQAEENGIGTIDLLVVNLYPFEATVARADVTREEAVEQIDIGGPALLRGAAKNHESVSVVVDPADYEAVLTELEKNGDTEPSTRRRLAVKVYQHTSAYDAAISTYLAGREDMPAPLTVTMPHASDLRYGDNPHQTARLYGNFASVFDQLQGKELSYTNVLDIAAAAELIGGFDECTLAILKHTNPCGVGSGSDLCDAWEKAYATDRQAPFGGVVVCNRPVTEALAFMVREIFMDLVIAPGFDDAALTLLKRKKNLRLMRMTGNWRECLNEPVVRSAPGGMLVMDADSSVLGLEGIRDAVKTKRTPTEDEQKAMAFGWKVVKAVKSNAIVFAGPDRTLGIGAGQMSRVDSCRIAVWKAGEAGLSLAGSAVASDAMFPFADGLIAAAEAGATTAIQPGGSIRDDEVIAAADEHDMAMCFTGHRHFRH